MKTVGVLQEQVVTNTGRLDSHSQALNIQADAIETIIHNLSELKIHTARQENKTDAQLNAILDEVRKGNKATSTTTQDNLFPPLPQSPSHSQRKDGSTKANGSRGWEHDWKPVNDSELSMLIDKEDPVRKLINNNLRGLTSLYFIREKQGNIGMVRTLIERQLRLGRIIKGLNFIG